MPATAGRVRMPANNRVHSSAALQTHGIWQVAIGYDPYAPADKDKERKPGSAAVENAYDSFQGLLSLARLTNASTNETRGACKKCGRVGHLTYQCRNFLSLKDDRPADDDDSALRTAGAVFEKMKKAAGGGKAEDSESEEEEDDDEISSSESDVDPEIERIIAERFGKPLSKKVATLSKGIKKSCNSSGDEEEEEDRRKKRKHEHKKKRRSHGRSRHRHRSSDSSDDESDSDRHRKHKRRRRRRSESSESNSGMRHKERRSVLSSDSESTDSSSDDDERRKRREKRRSKGHRRGGRD